MKTAAFLAVLLLASTAYADPKADQQKAWEVIKAQQDAIGKKTLAAAAKRQACTADATCKLTQELCSNISWVNGAKARIADEKANAGGVVNLVVLHDQGETITTLTPVIAQEKAQYTRLTHKTFDAVLCK